MSFGDEPADDLDRVLDRLQTHSPDRGTDLAGVDPETAQVIRELHLLSLATPVRDGFLQELERRLALEFERLTTGQPKQSTDASLAPPDHVRSELRVDDAAGEPAEAPASRGLSSPAVAVAAGEAQHEPPSPRTQSADVQRWPVRILIVDDDRELVDLLEFALRRAGLEPLAAHDASTALTLFKEQQPSLVVLDINLGGPDGLDVLRELRRQGQVPVMMLTARDSEEDKVRGLELGADDYLTKPFSHRELIARIRAQLRRSGTTWATRRAPETRLQVGTITLDLAEHAATNSGHRVNLTVTEFRLLHCLMTHAGTVVPTSTLLMQVWGYQDPAAADVVRVTVHRLRRKLEQDPTRPTLLHTIPGVGVLLKPKSEPRSA
jgi:two-component system, OmpR family, response regulator VicR